MPQQNNRIINVENSTLVLLLGSLYWFRKELFDDSQKMAITFPLAAGAIQFVVGQVMNRQREERDCSAQHLHINSNQMFNQMERLYKEGENAINKYQDYTKAAVCFKRARMIFEPLYKDSNDTRINELYITCCYSEALALYHEYQYENAQELINTTLDHSISNPLLMAQLFNLHGLISFIKSYLVEFHKADDVKSSQYWLNEARNKFSASKKLIQNQPAVAIFLYYLNDKTDYLMTHIPNAYRTYLNSLNVQHSQALPLSLDGEAVLHTMMPFLFAEASMKQNQAQVANALYRLQIAGLNYNPKNQKMALNNVVLNTNPDAFFETIIIRLRRLEACKGLNRQDEIRTTLAEIDAHISGCQLMTGSKAEEMYERAHDKLKEFRPTSHRQECPKPIWLSLPVRPTESQWSLVSGFRHSLFTSELSPAHTQANTYLYQP